MPGKSWCCRWKCSPSGRARPCWPTNRCRSCWCVLVDRRRCRGGRERPGCAGDLGRLSRDGQYLSGLILVRVLDLDRGSPVQHRPVVGTVVQALRDRASRSPDSPTYFARGVRWCLPFGCSAAICSASSRMTGPPTAGCPVTDASSSAETPAWGDGGAGGGRRAVPDASTVAAAAAGALPRAKAAARPAIAAGAAAMVAGAEQGYLNLRGQPKGLLPAKVALTRKAAWTVHWRCTSAGSLRSA